MIEHADTRFDTERASTSEPKRDSEETACRNILAAVMACAIADCKRQREAAPVIIRGYSDLDKHCEFLGINPQVVRRVATC